MMTTPSTNLKSSLSFVFASLALVACSGDDSAPTPSNTDAGATADSGSTATPDAASTGPKTVTVTVGAGGLSFAPSAVTVNVGDTVTWTWASGGHSVVSGATCEPDGKFCNPSNASCGSAPTLSSGATYSFTFATAGSYPYFCAPHCSSGMVGTVTVQ